MSSMVVLATPVSAMRRTVPSRMRSDSVVVIRPPSPLFGRQAIPQVDDETIIMSASHCHVTFFTQPEPEAGGGRSANDGRQDPAEQEPAHEGRDGGGVGEVVPAGAAHV